MPTVILVLLIQPLVAVILFLILRRFQVSARLTSTLIICGFVGAVLVALFTFMRSTVPIAPYELSPGAWTPIYGQTIVSLYVGFGLGVNLAALIGGPYVLYKACGKGNTNHAEVNGR
jgi:hypothetical protein